MAGGRAQFGQSQTSYRAHTLYPGAFGTNWLFTHPIIGGAFGLELALPAEMLDFYV
jgi:hypothetical protein